MTDRQEVEILRALHKAIDRLPLTRETRPAQGVTLVIDVLAPPPNETALHDLAVAFRVKRAPVLEQMVAVFGYTAIHLIAGEQVEVLWPAPWLPLHVETPS